MLCRYLTRTGCRRLTYVQIKSIASKSTTAPQNEPILDYGSNANSNKHRVELEKCLASLQYDIQDVPIVIKGQEYRTSEVKYQLIPFEHEHKLAKFYYATPELIQQATISAVEAQHEWMNTSIEYRIEILERAANLVSGKYRHRLVAATMLGQAKTVYQAEIDAAAELADFFRFNAYYLRELLVSWPPKSGTDETNRIHFRPLEGFVASISPFNFTAIGGNLASAPTLLGNCVVWKPSDTAILSNYLVFELLKEAGLPDGVINFVPSAGLDFGRVVTGNRCLAGVNFTGSLSTFQWLWSEIGVNIKRYNSFPRMVGECGGKNFHLVHESADLQTAIAQTIRSAFEYSGQKCSACSRLYVPQSLWPRMKDQLVALVNEKLKIGPATDFDSFSSAVIDASAFSRITDYIQYAKSGLPNELQLLCGGKSDSSTGYYIGPTMVETINPNNRMMQDEIFGPVLTVYVYPDVELDKTLSIIGQSKYALTGAIFAQDEKFVESASSKLMMSAGNFYINDKSTGAVVGQQPFGGARLSGTNDKAGGPHYLMRWCSQLAIKRTLAHRRAIV